MTIYLVRHGESEANIDPSILMTTPDYLVNLTSKGVAQAKAVGKFLNDRGLNLKATISSPFKRTSDTLALITEFLSQRHAQMPPSVLLCERQLGLVNTLGSTYPAHFSKEYQTYKHNQAVNNIFFDTPVGGESPFDVASRVLSFMALYNIAQTYGDTDDIIIVAHAGVMKAFHHVLTCQPLSEFSTTSEPDNCEVWAYEMPFVYDGSKWPAVACNHYVVR